MYAKNASEPGSDAYGDVGPVPRPDYETARDLAHRIETALGPEISAESYELRFARSLLSTLIDGLEALARPRSSGRPTHQPSSDETRQDDNER